MILYCLARVLETVAAPYPSDADIDPGLDRAVAGFAFDWFNHRL